MSSWESEDQYCKTIFAVFDTALQFAAMRAFAVSGQISQVVPPAF